MKECDIRDNSNLRIKGTLKVLIKCRGEECRQINYDKQDIQNNYDGRNKKRKVKSDK